MRRLAWACAALSIAAVLGAATIALEHHHAAFGIATVFAVCFPVMGALVIRKHGSHSVGWLMTFIGVTVALHTLAGASSRAALLWEPGSLPGGVILSWVAFWLWIPGWMYATSLLPVLLPDGRPRGRRRALAWADGIVVALVTLVNAVLAWPLRGFVEEPVHKTPAQEVAFDRIDAVWPPEVLIILAFTLFSLGSLIGRYRRTRDPRLAWVIYGACLAVVFALIGSNRSVTSAVQVLEALALVGGIAVAMFRHNLYDIGVVVNRTLVYGGLTAVLAAAYFLSVLLLQLVLSPANDLAIAASTLAVAALFRPARSRVQRVVDRRFYRRKYDAQRTVAAFSGRLRNELSLDALTEELQSVVNETVQPAHVTLWLR